MLTGQSVLVLRSQPSRRLLDSVPRGEGPVSPPLRDGVDTLVSPLSFIMSPVQVTIGGEDAQVPYQCVAPAFGGLAQLNAIVPSRLAPGNQSVFITTIGIPRNAAVITVR